jgi:hypothetical protein
VICQNYHLLEYDMVYVDIRLTSVLEEHSAGWCVSTSSQKALCIMFAALRKSDTSFVSQPVRPGLVNGR